MKTQTLLLFCSVLTACSSEQPAAPSRPPIPPPITGTEDGGTSNGEGGVPSNCFDTTKNKPASTPDFLNQCSGTECFKFDNATRIEGLKPGAPLPPLN